MRKKRRALRKVLRNGRRRRAAFRDEQGELLERVDVRRLLGRIVLRAPALGEGGHRRACVRDVHLLVTGAPVARGFPRARPGRQSIAKKGNEIFLLTLLRPCLYFKELIYC